MQFDIQAVLLLNAFANKSSALSTLTVFFGEYFPYLVAASLLFPILMKPTLRERLRFLAEALIAALVARLVFVELIRLFIERLRPFAADASVVALLEETSFAFPSGHATFFFALATSVFLHNRRWGSAFYAAALLISLARIAAGVHYPTDILGGALLGSLVAWLAHRFFTTKTPAHVPPL